MYLVSEDLSTIEITDPMSLETFLKELKHRKKELEHLKASVISGKSNAQRVLSAIKNESSNIANFFGDNIFRPDNRRRKKQAIDAIDRLIELCGSSEDIIDDLLNKKDYCQQIGNDMGEWRETIVNFFPIIGSTSIIVPEFSKDWGVEIFAQLSVIVIGAGFASMAKYGFKAGLAIAAIGLLIGVIAGIVAGEKRKVLFEEFKQDADKSYREVDREIYRPLLKAQKEMNAFFKDLGNLLVKTGWVNKNRSNDIIHLVDVINKKSSEIKNLRIGYNMTMTMMQGRETKDLENILDLVLKGVFGNIKNKEEIATILKISYFDQIDLPIDEIKKHLDLDDEAVLKLRIRKLLIERKTPRDIAKFLEIEENKVQDVQNHLKKLDEYKKIAA
ncbi:hypothetical protein U6A24_20690 [Aquimarina gracilis]|uniref:Uncharacterized protein n=1 Tax=Aquimarina gracilis TaxID=874422 RepID=A0ABU6A177_9FLAO|nr:hypothetical protein [Aquimarina gracilis]MEB3347907.1 hypothetical protein [Aquimarina gracilis]